MATGILPNGSTTSNGPIHGPDLENNWNANVLPATMPRAGSSQSIRTPNGYLFDRLGSQGNRFPLLLWRIFSLRQPSPEQNGDSDSDGGSSDSDSTQTPILTKTRTRPVMSDSDRGLSGPKGFDGCYEIRRGEA
ncbi:uncharacterized protein ColSpa_02910 [Colletotrichum spaethianum]|uniref:Uncharacterized protein n=1 Tax=Colletotrichum spaethianum TaxID=700344 RepID=A0AA37L8P0_9PEZI|nr:uncharacterized protein ColSpa_02910 [Colletotrichum spaethianum]GKT42729.1 hypothetical protein ColSpa_02910 [Colletotrichum spaethianum]